MNIVQGVETHLNRQRDSATELQRDKTGINMVQDAETHLNRQRYSTTEL